MCLFAFVIESLTENECDIFSLGDVSGSQVSVRSTASSRSKIVIINIWCEPFTLLTNQWIRLRSALMFEKLLHLNIIMQLLKPYDKFKLPDIFYISYSAYADL